MTSSPRKSTSIDDLMERRASMSPPKSSTAIPVVAPDGVVPAVKIKEIPRSSLLAPPNVSPKRLSTAKMDTGLDTPMIRANSGLPEPLHGSSTTSKRTPTPRKKSTKPTEAAKSSVESVDDIDYSKVRVAVRSLVTCLAVLMWGQFGYSVFLFPLAVVIVAAYNKYRMEHAQRMREQMQLERSALDNSKMKMAMPKPPIWIRFSDTERVGFLKSFVDGLWPFFKEATEIISKNALDKQMKLTKPGMLTSIEVAHIDLGHIPPQIQSIKTIKEENFFCLDLQLAWGTKLDLKIVAAASRLKIPVQLADLTLLGTLRIMLGPFDDKPPFFKAVSVSFLTPPFVDFKLNAIFIPINRIPGLSSFLHNSVMYGFESMTWPQTIPIPMTEEGLSHQDLAALKYRIAVGVLRVRVKRAVRLRNTDHFSLTDPYCTVCIGGQKHRTTTQKDTLNPVWNEAFELLVYAPETEALQINLLDSDTGAAAVAGNFIAADTLGMVQIDIKFLEPDTFIHDRHFTLHGDIKSKERDPPEIFVDLEYKPFIVTKKPYSDEELNQLVHKQWFAGDSVPQPSIFEGLPMAQMKPQRISDTKLFVTVKALWNIDSSMVKKKIQVILKCGHKRQWIEKDKDRGFNAHKTKSYPLSITEAIHARSELLTTCHSMEESFCFDVEDVTKDSLTCWITGFEDPVIFDSELIKLKAKGSEVQTKYYQFKLRNRPVELEIACSLQHVSAHTIEGKFLQRKTTRLQEQSSLSDSVNDVCGDTGTKNKRDTIDENSKVTRRLTIHERVEPYIATVTSHKVSLDMSLYIITFAVGMMTLALSGYFLEEGRLPSTLLFIVVYVPITMVMYYDESKRFMWSKSDDPWDRRIDISLPEKELEAAQIALVQSLSRWVHLPSVERTRWINSTIDSLYPFIRKYVHSTIQEKFDEAKEGLIESKRLPSFLKIFELHDVDIGKYPPLFSGVSHYESKDVGEQIILDFDVVWCSDLRGGLRIGLNEYLATTISLGNTVFKGTVRVVLSPLVPVMPCFGNLAISFLAPPDISFDLFLGDLSILGVPLLGFAVDRILQRQISTLMLEPARVVTEIIPKEDCKRGMKPPGVGILRVKLISAQNLKNIEIIGKSDPQCVLMLHHDPPRTQESKIIHNNLNPVWEEYFEFAVENRSALFSFNIYDIDRQLHGVGHRKKIMGTCEKMLSDLSDDMPEQHVMTLQHKRKDVGSIKFELELKPFTEFVDSDLLESKAEQSVGVFYITIKHHEDIPIGGKFVTTVGGRSMKLNVKDDDTIGKRMEFFVQDLQTERMRLEVRNSNNVPLGYIEVPCLRMVTRDDRLLELFTLNDAVQGKVLLEMSLRTVQKSSSEVRQHLEGLSQIGILRLRIISGHGLRNIERFSKSDPYCEVSLNQEGHVLKQKTSHKNNNLNPVWNEKLEFILSTPHDNIQFSVRDYGTNVLRNSILGEVNFRLVDLVDRKDCLIRRKFQLKHPSKSSSGCGHLLVDMEFKPFLEENLALEMYTDKEWSSGVAFLNITEIANAPFPSTLFVVDDGKNDTLETVVNVPFEFRIRDIKDSIEIKAHSVSEGLLKNELKRLKKGVKRVGSIGGAVPLIGGKVKKLTAQETPQLSSSKVGTFKIPYENLLGFATEPSDITGKLEGLISGQVTVCSVLRTVSPLRNEFLDEDHIMSRHSSRTLMSKRAASAEGLGNDDTTDSEDIELAPQYMPSLPGLLTIEVLKCENLPAADTANQANPYVSVRFKHKFKGKELKGKTQIVKNNRNPNFARTLLFDFEDSIQNYDCEVIAKHAGRISKHELAKVSIDISDSSLGTFSANHAHALEFGPEIDGPKVAPIGQMCKYRLNPGGSLFLRVIDYEEHSGPCATRESIGGNKEGVDDGIEDAMEFGSE